MKSLIFDIRHYTIHDGPGIRTTVFFKGCPLRCWWCHNPESQEVVIEHVVMERSLDGKVFEKKLAVGSWQPASEVMTEIEKDAVFYAESGGGVTFSGGEPLLQADALSELIQLCKAKGFHTAIDTCGHAEPAAIRKVMQLADLWLYDLKLMDDAKHLEYTGVSNELALNNLEMLVKAGKKIIIRFPLIPGITDNPENLRDIAELAGNLGLKNIDVLPFHKIGKDKYQRLGKEYLLNQLEEPDDGSIRTVKDFFAEKGLKTGKF